MLITLTTQRLTKLPLKLMDYPVRGHGQRVRLSVITVFFYLFFQGSIKHHTGHQPIVGSQVNGPGPSFDPSSVFFLSEGDEGLEVAACLMDSWGGENCVNGLAN